ncbi:Uncharacterized protein HZ326_18392 [Fusarium oxysporum f. sp. albedinis]|nr:Uncharacterized protein HZ326_18392 [Fusarium oxysporum f. sp. albedinis]
MDVMLYETAILLSVINQSSVQSLPFSHGQPEIGEAGLHINSKYESKMTHRLVISLSAAQNKAYFPRHRDLATTRGSSELAARPIFAETHTSPLPFSVVHIFR